jgi:hypothetical protein
MEIEPKSSNIPLHKKSTFWLVASVLGLCTGLLIRVLSPSLTVLLKVRQYAHFFKQEVNLEEGSAGV